MLALLRRLSGWLTPDDLHDVFGDGCNCACRGLCIDCYSDLIDEG